MEIVSARVLADLRAGTPLRLDLGAGEHSPAGFYRLDRVRLPGIDIVADLNEPLDELPDDSVERVYTRHTLEHVEKLVPLLGEIARVTRPGGLIEIVVPHFSNPYYYSDPTHVRFFGLYTMYYFVHPTHQPARKVPAFYSDTRFRLESIHIRFSREGRFVNVLEGFVEWLVNRSFRSQHTWERRFAGLWPAWELRYLLRPDK